jgi:hypothetical protein
MATWAEFAEAEPALAEYGWQLLREEHGYAFLATVTRDGGPRVHPVAPFVAEGRLLVTIDDTSPKAHDLRHEPRYMLHAAMGDNDAEFSLRGRAVELDAAASRDALQARQELNLVELSADHVLFELDIDRVDAALWDDTEPRRQQWHSC